MPNTATSFNLSAYTRRQLRELATGHSLTQSTVVALAVDRFYSQTLQNGQPLTDVSIDHAQAQAAQQKAAEADEMPANFTRW